MCCNACARPTAFVAIDGDRVGETVEALLARLAVEEAGAFSQEIADQFGRLRQRLEAMGASVHFCHGDNLLASLPAELLDRASLADLPREPATVSIGLGWDARQALMALHLAKALGRNRIYSLLGEPYLEGEIVL